jgi:type IV secretory pathway VirB6-like protein
MQKSLRMTVLALGAVFFASSLALAAQTTPPPAPDAGATAPQHHAKTARAKKQSGKKGARKKGRKKSTSTAPK